MTGRGVKRTVEQRAEAAERGTVVGTVCREQLSVVTGCCAISSALFAVLASAAHALFVRSPILNRMRRPNELSDPPVIDGPIHPPCESQVTSEPCNDIASATQRQCGGIHARVCGTGKEKATQRNREREESRENTQSRRGSSSNNLNAHASPCASSRSPVRSSVASVIAALSPLLLFSSTDPQLSFVCRHGSCTFAFRAHSPHDRCSST